MLIARCLEHLCSRVSHPKSWRISADLVFESLNRHSNDFVTNSYGESWDSSCEKS